MNGKELSDAEKAKPQPGNELLDDGYVHLVHVHIDKEEVVARHGEDAESSEIVQTCPRRAHTHCTQFF